MTEPASTRRLLIPLFPLYRLALVWRGLRLRFGVEAVRRLRFPVVSIGNLSTGGSGKTPLTIALARALARRGVRVDVLSRGYGRQSRLAARVLPDGTAEDFGDEPILIAREAEVPVYVARQRYDAGLLAEADTDAESAARENPPLLLHLLDDGFQHRQLVRGIDILLLNRGDLTDRLLPAGNLREPLRALQRATVLAVPADEPEVEQYLREIVPIDRNSETSRWMGPVWRLHRKMEVPPVAGPVAAFCGIARPKQFFAGLEAEGLKVPLRLAFPDHFPYTRDVLEKLVAKARAQEVTAIVTTAKDFARLGNLAALFPPSLPLAVAQLRIQIEDEDAAMGWLLDRLNSAP